jgi:hypothetical protein
MDYVRRAERMLENDRKLVETLREAMKKSKMAIEEKEENEAKDRYNRAIIKRGPFLLASKDEKEHRTIENDTGPRKWYKTQKTQTAYSMDISFYRYFNNILGPRRTSFLLPPSSSSFSSSFSSSSSSSSSSTSASSYVDY